VCVCSFFSKVVACLSGSLTFSRPPRVVVVSGVILGGGLIV
jgi:hypothetical protein